MTNETSMHEAVAFELRSRSLYQQGRALAVQGLRAPRATDWSAHPCRALPASASQLRAALNATLDWPTPKAR